jgi:hypothetical protein
MKKLLFLLLTATTSFLISHAQSSSKALKKVLELKIAREGGANGASVAWHPGQKKYYAAMAGNIDFPLGVFDANGKLLSKKEQKTMFDVRGLWYNPNTKTLQMNGYNEFGWGEYKLDAKGMPAEVKTLHEDMNQPHEQSVGAFNAKEKKVYFFNDEGQLDIYNYEDADFDDYIELHLGQTGNGDEDYNENEDVIDQYNSTTVVYTGTGKSEIGLLNIEENRIELYDIKTGYVTKKLNLPDDAPVYSTLNFSYSNGIYWFFNKETRIWQGYK